jgi:hypothetical protein
MGDCRDLAISRLTISFAQMMDRVGELLMDRANRSDVREEQQLCFDARHVLKGERPALMAEFEKQLRRTINDRIGGKVAVKVDFSKADAANLTLVETSSMDESLLTGNITRIVENLSHDELLTLNRGLGYLLGRPDLGTDTNPLAPAAIVEAFADALKTVKTDRRIKFQILKELNQAPMGDIGVIYAELNQHLAKLKVVPPATRPAIVNRGGGADRLRARADAARAKADANASGQQPEVDVMAMFKRMYGSATPTSAPRMPQRSMNEAFGPAMGGAAGFQGGGAAGFQDGGAAGFQGGGAAGFQGGAAGDGQGGGAVGGHGGGAIGGQSAPMDAPGGDFPQIHAPGQGGPSFAPGPAGYAPGGDFSPSPGFHSYAPMQPTPSGYIPGAPIISTQDLHEGLTRLQAGQTGFDVGGATVAFSGIPQGMHNVLRDLQESPLGQKANQIESMTIEMVAMLFDFIFDTKDLPDGIKALLARIQIPVLKAAMLDRAFFAKKSHPSRLLVNALAQAGLGWSPVMGQDDPLYKKISAIVHEILDNFSDDLAIFDEQRSELEAFLAEEEKAAEENIQTTAEEINQRDRQQISLAVAKAAIERRIEDCAVPNFLASFLRQNWERTLAYIHEHDGEESEAWGSAVATLEDLVWSIQPKKTIEDRRHLVALLPSLLKRLSAGMHSQGWPPAERETFMANLVEAHAASVKPSLAAERSPTAAVAEAAKVQAEMAKAAGDTTLAAKAEALAEAMTDAVPEPIEPGRAIIDDDYLEIARSLERGMWIEFEADDGHLAFAKLAWVSPLRGTYLFTNRQGQKALSMTAEELAERFRNDRARLVEAEPLIDRAFTSMLSQMEDKMQVATTD